jgi:hypothetical protein
MKEFENSESMIPYCGAQIRERTNIIFKGELRLLDSNALEEFE